MKTTRGFLWGSAIVAAGVVLLLDIAEVYPAWVLVGPVVLGIAGVAFLADQIFFARERRFGFLGSLMMIALSAATVTQDAGLVIDEWSVWPFVAGALVLGVPLERYSTRRRRTTRWSGPRIGPSAGAHAR